MKIIRKLAIKPLGTTSHWNKQLQQTTGINNYNKPLEQTIAIIHNNNPQEIATTNHCKEIEEKQWKENES